ncbi:MAG: lycopene beta-cyclase CrtY [Kofleriaceae bacterium]|nr:lycopene beta-cyclase CrtY [Kofleriaceae bacterium]
MTPRPDVDLILVGGGLASGLIALAAKARRPEVRIALIERASTLGGNHTWCWHAGDTHACTWVEPLVVQRWDGYAVRFPTRQRELDEAYAVTTSARLDQVVRAALTGPGDLVRTGHVAASVATDHVVLDDGSTLTAPVVVDARGPDRLPPARAAYQKFVGLEVELAAPVGPSRPILMDAQVPQRGAFRFVYTLPFAPDRLLIEDTYYADTPELDHADIRAEVLAYAAAAGWPVQRVVREEAGVLPLPLDAVVTAPTDATLAAGYAGGWFHPTTGYSFPPAVRVAEHLATHLDDPLGPAWRDLVRARDRQQRSFLFLNRMLFGAFAPDDRWHVLARFYGLPPATIRRFYAMTTTAGDRARILCGRPPRGFSIRRALGAGASA